MNASRHRPLFKANTPARLSPHEWQNLPFQISVRQPLHARRSRTIVDIRTLHPRNLGCRAGGGLPRHTIAIEALPPRVLPRHSQISMSYDLMVFDPKTAPASRNKFIEWYRHQTKWQEGHSYDNPDISTPELRAWFLEMITHYPMMNGPYASEEDDSSQVTDYSIGHSVIYAGFAWSEARPAREMVFTLAQKHRVGFFDVSNGNGGVWMPSADGEYLCVHGQGAQQQSRRWWQFWKKQT